MLKISPVCSNTAMRKISSNEMTPYYETEGGGMLTELQLQTGAYRTTYIGTEVLRPSTIQEWKCYGEILRRVDEAKQWAIGDWLADGKRHYGDGLYKEASEILGLDSRTLENLKQISDKFEITLRNVNSTWSHHKEISSIKQIEELKNGKLKLSDEPDKEKMQWFLAKSEKDNWSVRFLREQIQKHKINQQKEIELANEPEKYKIIYADPPWKYNDELIEGYGAATHHYPPMTIQELCNLKIKNITTENSVLFLWVTSPFLNECWPIVKSWGFEYKSSFIWDKIKHNYGHYNSVRHEIL